MRIRIWVVEVLDWETEQVFERYCFLFKRTAKRFYKAYRGTAAETYPPKLILGGETLFLW